MSVGLDVPHRLPDLLLERGGMAAVGEHVALARDIERVAREDAGRVGEPRPGGADGLPPGEVAVGDAGDLDPRVARHLRDPQRRPRRGGPLEELAVVLVHLGVLVAVLEVDERLDDVVHVHADGLERLADLSQAVLDLLGELGVGAVVPLARDVQRLADHHSGGEEPVRPLPVLGCEPLGGDLAHRRPGLAQGDECTRENGEMGSAHVSDPFSCRMEGLTRQLRRRVYQSRWAHSMTEPRAVRQASLPPDRAGGGSTRARRPRKIAGYPRTAIDLQP